MAHYSVRLAGGEFYEFDASVQNEEGDQLIFKNERGEIVRIFTKTQIEMLQRNDDETD